MYMDPKLIYQIRESYRRCLNDGTFFEDFYNAFFASSIEIKKKFEHVNMMKQRAMLAEGVTKLLAYAETNEISDRFLQIAELHSRRGLNVTSALYLKFIDTFMTVIKKIDADMSPEVEQGWRDCLKKGIDFFSSHY